MKPCKHQNKILVVKLRHTYEFVDLILGRANTVHISQTISRMTVQEHIILSRYLDDYAQLWWEVFGVIPSRLIDGGKIADYDRKCLFFKNMLRTRRSAIIVALRGPSNSDTPWVIPGGAPKPGELNIDCACREFSEETGVHANGYVPLYHVNPSTKTKFVNNFLYRSIYFYAVCFNDVRLGYHDRDEIEMARFVNMNELKNLCPKLAAEISSEYKKLNKIVRNII